MLGFASSFPRLNQLSENQLNIELIEILRGERMPLNIEQLVQKLFHRREQISDLVLLTRASMKRKQKLKSKVSACLEQGFALKSQINGQWVYTLNPDDWMRFMMPPQPMRDTVKRVASACGFLVLVACCLSALNFLLRP